MLKIFLCLFEIPMKTQHPRSNRKASPQLSSTEAEERMSAPKASFYQKVHLHPNEGERESGREWCLTWITHSLQICGCGSSRFRKPSLKNLCDMVQHRKKKKTCGLKNIKSGWQSSHFQRLTMTDLFFFPFCLVMEKWLVLKTCVHTYAQEKKRINVFRRNALAHRRGTGTRKITLCSGTRSREKVASVRWLCWCYFFHIFFILLSVLAVIQQLYNN